jgi:hypothetical protein
LAKWLHRRLEGYRIDADLVGLETPAGPVPQSLRPILRDREDFNGGQSLGEATIAALDASAALLVVCSQVSGSLSSMAQPLRAGTADRRS